MKRFVLFLLVLAGATAYAQEFRGALTGQVTDPTGAAIANVPVAVTSTATGATSHTVTGSQGFYNVPFLAPGEYQISVDAPGFKKYTQTGINVLTAQTMTVNVKMELGSESASVTVHADAALLDIGDASAGEVMTADELSDLPSNGRTPLGFARDAYGAIPKMKHATASATPFQGSTADDFSLGGGLSSSNELLLNGVPNMQDSSRTALFSPQMDSVSSVRVDEFNANASMGDTSGGTIDITTKAGTNQFHGAASEYYQDTRVGSAKPFLTIPGASIVSSHDSQYGGAIGGPVWIPKIFNGRNKLFFEYAYEGYVGSVPPTSTVSEVPTCAERGQNAPTGSSLFCTDNPSGTPDYPDFSALLAANSTYQLYDPFSSTGTGATFARAKIPNNQFVNATNAAGGTGIALDPIARNLLQYVPAPNTAATATSTGENNYTTYSPNPANYKSHSLRLDYNISQSNKIFGEAHRGKYLTSGSDYFHDLATGTITDQIYSGGLVDDVETFTPTLTLDSRLGMSRYQNVNAVKSSGISPTTFGFPGYIASNSTAFAMPRINFTDSVSPVSIGVVPGSLEFQDTIQLFEMFTKVRGRHTYKAGVDIRAQKQSNLSPGDADGLFTFTSNTGTNNPIAVNDNSNANTVPFGGAFALFDMGITTGAGTENINQAYQYNNWYQAYFIQDDWKAAPNLTISVGLRMEHETPEVESQNRTVTGWNPTATNAMTTAAAAAYGPALTADAGSTSLPYLPTSINPTGGVIYATSSNRSAYQTAPIYLSPRVGISWAPNALHQKTVFRFGIGVYNNPFDDYSGSSANTGQTYGFSATSSVTQNGTVTSNTQTPWTLIDDPFPTCTTCAIPASPIVPVTGSAYGINQNLDQALQFDAPVKVPYTERVSVDIQHQFGTNWMIEAGYILAHGVHTTYNNIISSVPLLPFLNRGPYNNATLSSALTSTGTGFGIANPFKGLGAPYTNSQGMLTASRIAATQALSPWPEYSSVQEDLIPGASTEFNALNTRLQKRMSYGLDMNITFTYSKLLAIAQNNAGGPLNYQENSSDFPLKLSAQVIYDLPFGIGRQWMNHSKILDEGLGGWEISTNYGFLSGAVISWSNAVYQGDGSWKDFAMHAHAYSTSVPAFNIATIYNANTNANAVGTTPPYSTGAPGATNYRTFPQNLLRQDHENNWDMSMFKGFRAGDWALLQLRIDAFNAFNRPQFTNASTSTGSSGSFGLVNNTASGSAARTMQGGLHLVF
ncbi:MAG: carboxypeptidase-like regulatory domain-containing protein [Candidatus Korobacteraceae bacterium]